MPSERVEDRRDVDLHRRLMLGERSAFEELYRRYAAAAFGLSFRVTGHGVILEITGWQQRREDW